MNPSKQREEIERNLAGQGIGLAGAVALIPGERHKYALELRLGLRGPFLTYNEIGLVMGLSRQRAHQLVHEAVQELEKQVTRSQRAHENRGEADVIAKETLHRLVDDLPDSQLGVAARLLKALRFGEDVVERALDDAPVDDEPDLDDSDGGLSEARREPSISNEEARRRLLGQ
ncbi:MAG: sigma factor-like helix-turn-helix DNA-binding protein [Vicinamibacteria bacterium]